MEFRVRVETLERRIVCLKTNVQSMKIVKTLKQLKHGQFVLRTKGIGTVRIASSTIQTCALKSGLSLIGWQKAWFMC